jgi:hypothetical protein
MPWSPEKVKEEQRKRNRRCYQKNKQTIVAAVMVRLRENPELTKRRVRNSWLRRKYGITLEQYEALNRAQRGLCKICGKPDKTGRQLAVDHCHKTRRVRGLLCGNCNQMIGHAQDNPQVLRDAAVYLE